MPVPARHHLGVGDVVTLEGDTIFSNNTFVNDNPVHVIMTLNVVSGDISFTFDPGGAVTGAETFLTGTGKVRIAGHP